MPSGGPETTRQEIDRGSRLGAPFGPLFTGFFEGNFASGGGNVAAEPRSSPPSAAALSFPANLLIVATTLNRSFANEAPLAVKSHMAAPGAEGLSRVGYWRRQFRATARVAAHATHDRFGKLSHQISFGDCLCRCWQRAWLTAEAERAVLRVKARSR
jgi:hypothetical protein